MPRATRRASTKREIEARFVRASGSFAEDVKRRMARRGISGAELARRLEVSRAEISRILAAGSNPTLRTMVALAHALDGEIEIVFHRPSPLAGIAARLRF